MWTLLPGLFISILILSPPLCGAKKADMNYRPSSKVLYRVGIDKVVNLDHETFDDTVFNNSNPVLVEVYKDWCGHCRRFLPTYREFAKSVENWADFVVVSALNCAEMNNRHICEDARAHGKLKTVPSMKFYPPGSTKHSDLSEFAWKHRSVDNMRKLLLQMMIDQGGLTKRIPNLLDIVELEGDLGSQLRQAWAKLDNSHDFLVIVFENADNDGHAAKAAATPQVILDLYPYRAHIGVVAAKSNSLLASHMGVREKFPLMALFKRGSYHPQLISSVERNATNQVVKLTGLPPLGTQLDNIEFKSAKPKIDCEANPEGCKQLFFVSETDILKTLRIALYNEILNSDQIRDVDFGNLHNFVKVLLKYLPVETSTKLGVPARNAASKGAVQPLATLIRAKRVLSKLDSFLQSKNASGKFSASEWNSTFLAAEEENHQPFAQESDWQHCQGSGVEYRGFTCGLWMTFHTLTINSHLNHQAVDGNSTKMAIDTLWPIHGWVSSFFSCSVCVMHFKRMTSDEYVMDYRHLKSPGAVFTYLWRAHNLVNWRIRGDSTEDPQFPKDQFPPKFLCPDCHASPNRDSTVKVTMAAPGAKDRFNEERLKDFLLEYYTHIVPHNGEKP